MADDSRDGFDYNDPAALHALADLADARSASFLEDLTGPLNRLRRIAGKEPIADLGATVRLRVRD